MSKEMVVSASSQDTKIAILEEGQVVEVYFEREQEYSLAGSIYKGRVTRILPGMQSAFVNIGLERDAFLYVSDFMEQVEEYDRVGTTGEDREGSRRSARPAPEEVESHAYSVAELIAPASAAVEESRPTETAPPSATELAGERVPEQPDGRSGRFENRPGRSELRPEQTPDRGENSESGPGQRDKHRRFSRRGRRNRGGPRGLPESKYARAGAAPAEERPAAQPPEPPAPRILLPGESLAKYKEPVPSREITEKQAAASMPDSFGASLSAPWGGAPSGGGSSSAAPTMPAEHSQAPAAAASEFALPGESRALDRAAPYREPQPEALGPEARANAEAWEHHSESHTGPDAGQHKEISSAPAQTDTLSDENETEGEEPLEFLSAVEAVEAVREEKMIEDLEEEAAEIVESESLRAGEFDSAAGTGEAPSWELTEDRVLDVIDDAEPDSPEPGGPEMFAEPAVAGEEISGEYVASAATNPPESGEASRQATVRERSGNPRFQRKQRWAARRQQRGDRGARGEQDQRRGRTGPREAPKPLIGDMLKEGQEILVQVAKEPLGRKGARITSHIALPGRYIVYMPTLDHTGVSRKIASDEERYRLKRIIVEQTRNLSGGFIVRTAGEGHSEEDLRQDVQFLVNLWAEIKAKAEKSSAPALLHHDLDLTLRTLRDQLSDDFQTIWVDNEQAYEQIVSLVQKFQPALVHRVRLYTKDVPLFEETGVQDEINKALKPKVWLKSGGYIVINQTEALVAIDVNTGKFVGKSNRLEDTIVRTNVEAIQEIVRQIRLRDLGGIIVIDFIDMDERKNRQKVMTTLEDAMRADKAPSKILAFNEFGLLAITRKRVRQSLERTLCQPCAYCTGSGLVKSPPTVCLEILTEARKMASELEGKQVTLRVNPEVAKALKARDSAVLEALEEITGSGIIIRGDAAVHIENFYFD